MKFTITFLMFAIIFLSGCAHKPPKQVDNICRVFQQYPSWKRDAHDVARRWRVPVSVQMAIIHQESKFDSQAKPARQKLLWVIPWTRPSSAYGYAQALKSTWAVYKKKNGGFFSSRSNFADAVDFIGWYADQAYIRAKIPRSDAYQLYLAYHEGVGGFMKKTYLNKPWLMTVAHKVSNRANIYQNQLKHC